MTIDRLDMFYETRQAVHVSDSDPSNSPNTDLKSVPKSAEIRYDGYPDRHLDAEAFEAPNGKGFETARMLLGRAMLDPDATVVPT